MYDILSVCSPIHIPPRDGFISTLRWVNPFVTLDLIYQCGSTLFLSLGGAVLSVVL